MVLRCPGLRPRGGPHFPSVQPRRAKGRTRPVIKLDHVSKSYGNDVIALDDVSVEIGKGEFVFVVGQSGSGKSTFLRLLTKEERPTGGRIWVAGKELNRLASWKVPALRRSIGCVFRTSLPSNKTMLRERRLALEVIGAGATRSSGSTRFVIKLAASRTNRPVPTSCRWREARVSITGVRLTGRC